MGSRSDGGRDEGREWELGRVKRVQGECEHGTLHMSDMSTRMINHGIRTLKCHPHPPPNLLPNVKKLPSLNRYSMGCWRSAAPRRSALPYTFASPEVVLLMNVQIYTNFIELLRLFSAFFDFTKRIRWHALSDEACSFLIQRAINCFNQPKRFFFIRARAHRMYAARLPFWEPFYLYI